MKPTLFLSLAAALAVAAGARADDGPGCAHCRGVKCITPEPYCPDCSEPCDHRLKLTVFGPDHAQRLINELCTGCCHERIHAAHKLGSRLHADFCCDPEVVTALVKALQCDTCWEVRYAAGWSLAMQGARTRLAVLALYLSSKLDPHYVVRQRSAEALDVMLVCRRDCYRDLFDAGDALAARLRGKYKPTDGSCVSIFEDCLALVGEAPVLPGALPPGTEKIGPPKGE